MTKKLLANRLLLAGGVAELLIAAAHYLMPLALGRAVEINNLPAAYRDYVVHATMAVGFCMTAFGLLSLYFSRRLLAGERFAWVFCLSQGLLWTTRIVSELVLPVKIPLLFLATPTTVILPIVIGIALLFLVPTALLWPRWPFTLPSRTL